MIKLLFEPKTKRIFGAGIAGAYTGELIGEEVLALEMGADAEEIRLGGDGRGRYYRCDFSSEAEIGVRPE